MTNQSPYQEAVAFIKDNPGSGSSKGMARLILSLWKENCGFSIRECMRAFDRQRQVLAVKVLNHFLQRGEDEDLRKAGHEVREFYPRTYEIACVMRDARDDQARKWEEEDQRKWEETQRRCRDCGLETDKTEFEHDGTLQCPTCGSANVGSL